MSKTRFTRIFGVSISLHTGSKYANYIGVGRLFVSWVSNGRPPFSIRYGFRKSLRIGRWWFWFSRVRVL